jgi:hypothetical protein
MTESNARPPEKQAPIGAALPPNFITIAAIITGPDEAGVWHGRAPRGNGEDPAPAYLSLTELRRRNGHDRRVEDARAVRIEDELGRRGVRLRGGGIDRCGPCPVCGGDDRFSINIKKQVWNCRGCSTGGDVIALVQHIDGSDFKGAVETLAGSPCQAAAAGKPKRLYFPYTDEAGVALSREVRLQYPDGSKITWQEAADPDQPGEWIKGEGCMTGVRRVPFELAKLNEGLRNGATIFIPEGPRKCGPLHKWGLYATCNMGGSGAASIWREHAKEFFLPVYNSPVVILPDRDAPGAKSAAIIADALASVGVAVSLLDLISLPNGDAMPPKGDIINWHRAGGTRQQFLDLVKTEARAWEPSEPEYSPDGPSVNAETPRSDSTI